MSADMLALADRANELCLLLESRAGETETSGMVIAETRALVAALGRAGAEQEPVGWLDEMTGVIYRSSTEYKMPRCVPLYTHPAPAARDEALDLLRECKEMTRYWQGGKNADLHRRIDRALKQPAKEKHRG